MEEPSVRLRLAVAYDGAGFSGWAAQPDRRTVEGVLRDALGRVLRLPAPQLTVAGRTDAGVHARGQVAHVDVPAHCWQEEQDRLVRRLAGVLPGDVRVAEAAAAPEGFDARFSALYRRYAYRVTDDPAGPEPLRRHDVVWRRRPLDLGRMNRAAAHLLGEHDFAAFCRPRPGATTIRTLQQLEWSVDEGRRYRADVQADAFCHNMVRALVGALLAVGEGRRETDWPRSVLDAGVRDSSVHVAPAHGLVLQEVGYPPEAELAARAARTRRVRAL